MLIVKTPGINGLGRTKGCRNAGNAILESLKKIYTSEAGKKIEYAGLALEEIHVNNNNLPEQEKLIYENALESFESQDKVIFLGGDHSISYPIGKAFLKYSANEGKIPCLIVFDSHPDCMEPVKEPTHEEWLRALVDKGFTPENILVVGMRNAYEDELKFLEENKIKRISINDLNENLQEYTDTITEFAYGKILYVSLDIDVADPAFAPSTGYPEPGGLTSRQLIYIVQRLGKMKNLKAVDIVEVNSENDRTESTTKLAAKILAEIL
jgi:agmatinase